jgi:hypothetical protein
MFRWESRVSVLVILSFFMIESVALAAPWPGSSTGTEIGDDLPSGFEPSGIVWDNFTGALWLVTPRSSNDFTARSRQGSNPPRLILWMSGQ